MDKKKYRRLTYQERIIIETLLNQGKKKADIAKKINRTRSTISREVNKWGDKPGSYDGSLAHWCADNDYENKRYKDKISTYPKLKSYVYKMLENKLSPEQIAGRIKIKYPGDKIMSISHEATSIDNLRARRTKDSSLFLLTIRVDEEVQNS